MVSSKKDITLYEVNLVKPADRIVLLLIQTAEVVLKCADAVLTKAGLSLVKLMVLQVLEAQGGALTPSVIASLILRDTMSRR